MTEESLLEFPCSFPVKVFGAGDGDFEQAVYALIKPHVPELNKGHLSAKQSSGGRYLAVTVNITAHSQTQLDAIYQALTDDEQVLMAL